jgi:periplasmic protein TonB
MLYRVRDQTLTPRALTPRARGRRVGRRRIAGGFAASLLLHAVILGALLVRLKWEPQEEPLPPPSTVSMLFEGGRPQGPSSPEPTPLPGSETTQNAPTGAPHGETAPAPQGSPPPPAPKAPTPEVQRETPPPPQVTPTPPIPPPAMPPPPTPPPPTPPPPTRGPNQPVEPAPSDVTVPPPPPQQIPAPSQPPVPSPSHPQTWPPIRQATPNRPPSDFPAPMDFSLGGPPEKPGEAIFGKPLLSLTLPHRGPNDPTPYSVDTDADVGLDWRNALSQWVEEHSYYPNQAAEMHQQGSVKVLVTTLPNGQVTSVELERGSGSPWLDLALEGMFRGAKLPPLPKSAGDQPVPFHFTMHYILIR